MSDNQLIQFIHSFQALDEKWRELSPEQKRQLLEMLKSDDVGVSEVWTALKAVSPAAKREGVCDLCYKRRVIAAEVISKAFGVLRLCRKCKKADDKRGGARQ